MPDAVPAIYQWREYVDATGLLSYGESHTEAYRLGGTYAAEFERAKSLRTCHSCSPQDSIWSSISRLPSRFNLTIPPGLLAIGRGAQRPLS